MALLADSAADEMELHDQRRNKGDDAVVLHCV